MIVQKNADAMARKHFLIRALRNKNVTQEEYDEEIALLEPFIKKNLAEALVKCETELRSEINQVKQVIVTDGDLKRAIAKMLMGFLAKDFTPDEIKGIFRQGYKIQRLK